MKESGCRKICQKLELKMKQYKNSRRKELAAGMKERYKIIKDVR